MTEGIVQINDVIQRRIVIPKDIWKAEGLTKGDYIKIDIKKIDIKKEKD